MASYQQLNYCKKCHKNVTLNDKGQCTICLSTSITKSWSVRFRIIDKGKEKQKRLTGFSTKKECQSAYIKYILETTTNAKISTQEADSLRFNDLYEEYKKHAKTNLKESSFYDFCTKTQQHILPFFKNILVKDITAKLLLEWQNKVSFYEKRINKKTITGTYSYKYKTNLRMYLNTMLNYAENYYNIENKLKKVEKFRDTSPKKEMAFWTPDEFNKFIEHVHNEVFKVFFYALYFTGARKGEILATSWDDWDLNNGFLKINKTVTKKVFDAPWLITTPKNESSIRIISLPQGLIEILRAYKKGKENFKFVFYKDKPLADTSIERAKNQACLASGVKKIRIHDFRHSHASLLLGSGISVVAVAKRLGHSNIEQTLNTYAHQLPREDADLLSVLQNSTNINK